MCSISASKDKKLLLKLVDLNRYRGEESHSVSQFLYTDDGLDLKSQTKSYGPLDLDLLDGNWDYCVVHQQAPTSKEVNNTDLATGRFIHPAEKDKSYLWHNGIIKEGKFEGDWDTEWLFDQALNEDLNEVDGTFACMLYHENQIYVFRNEISPLFKDSASFSSTKFEGSTPAVPNIMWKLDYGTGVLEEKWKFKTKENPYHFGE
jgi:hypothetical protein|tara:strand:- start:4273 stop:4884 length:612 start_codon:yes stop_codon:yes gene_type:complete